MDAKWERRFYCCSAGNAATMIIAVDSKNGVRIRNRATFVDQIEDNALKFRPATRVWCVETAYGATER